MPKSWGAIPPEEPPDLYADDAARHDGPADDGTPAGGPVIAFVVVGALVAIVAVAWLISWLVFSLVPDVR